jgi:hypothetical protein
VLEALECRLVPSGYQPTPWEQLFLEELNDARANPAAYGQSIGVDLSNVAPAAALAMDPRLVQSARDHSQDMNNNAYFSHTSPSGTDPGQRMSAAGFPWNAWAESIAAGYSTVEQALQGLVTDAGVPDLGHRLQLLGIGSPYNLLTQVGIGIVINGGGPYADYYTIDSAVTTDTRPFLTGVVYNDTNGNGRYDPGEGLGGVTISVAGAGSTTTFGSGGYSLQVSPGTYTVTASGGGLPGVFTQVVAVGSTNVRLNFNAQSPPPAVAAAPAASTPALPPPPAPSAPLSGAIMATGADAGGGPDVRVFAAQNGAFVREFLAYDPHFLGGVRVAVGDINQDGSPDIITAPGPGGGPDLRVWDGRSGALIREFSAYSPAFVGGVNLAVGDVNGDGVPDIITGADAGGGPEVKAFSGTDGSVLMDFLAYDARFTGGVRVAAGDVDADGKAEVITAPGPGGGPDVRVFAGNGALVREFLAYDPHFLGGVYVAAGDVNGDGHADIITGPGTGGGPNVEVFSGLDNALLQNFMAYGPTCTTGVRVGAVALNGSADILTAPGCGTGPQAQIMDGHNLAVMDSFFAYDPQFQGGVFVGGN